MPPRFHLKYHTQRRGHSPQIREDEGCDPNKQHGEYRMNWIAKLVKRWLDSTEPPMHDPDNMSGATS